MGSSPVDTHTDAELKAMLGEEDEESELPAPKGSLKIKSTKGQEQAAQKSTKGQEQQESISVAPKLSLKVKTLSYDSMKSKMSTDQGFSEDCTGLDVWCVSLAKCVDYKVYDSACSGKASKENAKENNKTYPGRAAVSQVCFSFSPAI
jgi:hypothetical protein